MTPALPTNTNASFRYPSAPALSNTDFLNPSPTFKKHVKRTLLGIVGFCLLYLSLIAFGLALGYVCVLGTILVVSLSINKFTIIIGLGLLAFGVMFLLFLVKFLFTVYRNQDAQRVEIMAKDHPLLFAFIDRLTDDVNAPKPYKIYLSPNVNASVFYNSSFWSLFLPIRKNLEIGLGLVNSINMSEFKAVMAHEFGHFSQRSMKLGSYVYVVNRVIYNLVHERDRWDTLLDRWASSGGLWSIFAKLTHLLVNLIRRILSKAYQLLNLRYMGLSREMEYQADLVAVSAAGGQSIITALRRIELADAAYHQLLTNLNGLIGESKRTKNIYPLHSEAMQLLAAENGIVMTGGLPVLDDEQALRMAPSNRVYYQDQWSSHPSQAEREANVRTVSAPCVPEETSPWSLFTDPERWQQRLTERLYEGVEATGGAVQTFIEPADYTTYVTEQAKQANLPERYNSFYDRRLWYEFDPVAVSGQTDLIPDERTLFSDENRKLRKQLFTAFDDRNTLEQIRTGQIQTRSFDFDGQKYDRSQADTVLTVLNSEIEALQVHFQRAEEDAFRWHYQKAAAQGLGDKLLAQVQLYFRLDAERETYAALYDEFSARARETHQALANNNNLRKGLAGEIEVINEKIQQAYQHSRAIQLPDPADLTDGVEYAAYLCPEKPQVVDCLPLNWEQMVTLYQQLEAMHHRAAHVQIAVLNQLIHWQVRL